MDVEMYLARAVRDWTEQSCPDEPELAESAVTVALESFACGASVAEACERSRSYVMSRIEHPARVRAVPSVLPVAS